MRVLGCVVPLMELCGQVDPERRRLVQVGYNAPLEGKAPFAGYAFYYHNEPGFVRPDWTLRAAVAPVYGDVELAFRGLPGGADDVAVGVAGGGYADSHAEIREGRWIRQESFTGHAGEVNASWYHRFNPADDDGAGEVTSLWDVPLQSVLRGGFRGQSVREEQHHGGRFPGSVDDEGGVCSGGIAAGVDASRWYVRSSRWS